ncbi:hypothetical protein Btru_030189 [Bulinus truncatus]|nr:hypothetical protein Btru_030189 [Bulinus truncatus]
MDQGKLFNLVGTMLIIFATSLHIVCLVTPHFTEADDLDVFNMQRLNQKSAENFSITPDLTNNGLKISNNTPGWIRAVQAMGIIGVLLSTAAIFIALINMLVVSKGDRLRLIHIFIASSCFAAGGFLLLGNLIMAANFKDVILMLDDATVYPPLAQWQEIFSDHSYLSWGFALDVVAFALAMLAGVAHLIGGRIVIVENELLPNLNLQNYIKYCILFFFITAKHNFVQKCILAIKNTP